MVHLYWFDMGALQRLPSVFTVEDIATISGVDSGAARLRVRKAREAGVLRQTNPGQRVQQLTFTDKATERDKMLLIAAPVREQVKQIVARLPSRFTNQHIYRHLFDNTYQLRHLFMINLQDSGVVVRQEPCKYVPNTFWWTRADHVKGAR